MDSFIILGGHVTLDCSILQGTCTSLYGASMGGNPKIVQYLLDHGADVNQPTDVSNCLHNNYLLTIRH